jgi:hypothetical protein
MFAVNGETPEGEARSGADRPGTPTRGFLFADLRGYTEFVERNGAAGQQLGCSSDIALLSEV